MVGFLFLTYRFLEPIAEFTEVLDQTQTAVAGLRRVLGVLDMPIGPPPTDSPVPLPAGMLDVRVSGVTFAYPTRGVTTALDEAVLRNVDVYIPAGQQVAMVGATGSGKTTLGRLIARFADPTVGRALPRRGAAAVRQQRRAAPAARRRVTGAVPVRRHDRGEHRVRQAANVARRHRGDGRSARAARLGRLDARRADDACRRARRAAVGRRAPARRAVPRRRGRSRRARARRGDVVGRRAHRGAHLAGACRASAEGRTTIAIAHRLSTAARADRVLVLDEGVLVEDGTHAELVEAGGHYARLHDAWMLATTVM